VAYRSRILDPGCSWLTLPEVQPALDDLKNQDPFTLAGFIGMQRDATSLGMVLATWVDELDYRAPIKRAPTGVTKPPWLGELKRDGKPRRRKAGLTWRMYFGEPTKDGWHEQIELRL
jgi:hypothetical protein